MPETPPAEIRTDYLPFGKPNFSELEIDAVCRVLRSGWIGMGHETQVFEEELARYLAVPHVVTVSSCTSALFLSLLALGVGPGDEVICPSLTWCATANAALYLGATPVFCDVDSDSLCVGPAQIAEKVTSRTKAVIPVHLGGFAVEVAPIRSVLPDRVAIVEDAAHALGASFQGGAKVGASGNLTCFSFYANKNLSTGEGGAIALHDGDLANRLRSLRQSGMPANAWQRFTHRAVLPSSELTELGYKMNYTDLQAAIGRVQLARQDELCARRLAVALRYRDVVSPCGAALRFQSRVFEPAHSRHLLVVTLGDTTSTRDELLVALRRRNVGASIHYAPLHQMPLYRRYAPTALPVTDDVSRRILTLPISASMSVEDADYVGAHLRELL